MQGKLYLIPVDLGDAPYDTYIPPYNLRVIDSIDIFVVENARTARHFLRKLFRDKDLSTVTIYETDKHHGYAYPKEIIAQTLNQGKDVGFMSEAGCPGVADPGAKVVCDCHQSGIEVVPLVGPSSILLGLMASGLSGQSFRFRGYLPFEKERRKAVFRDIAHQADRYGETQIFIEAPYRNDTLLKELSESLPPHLSIVVCADLTTENQSIKRLRAKDWNRILAEKKLSYHKRPAIFLVGK